MEKRDRPEACEIEITPEMIEAGLGAWSDFDERFESPEEMIERVYRAMISREEHHFCHVVDD